jgi:hypothetical protein
MIRIPWLSEPLTDERVRYVFMLMLEDDTEDAPWMVMGDAQFWSAAGFAFSLRHFAREHGLPWYVASMHPILFSWPGITAKKQLAPDVFVAFVPDHPRSSFDADVEGGFPPFVLEVVSPSSSARDQVEKRQAYEDLKVKEYALFTPNDQAPSLLEGFRRNAAGCFETWPRDSDGRLWSEVLGLHLLVRGAFLHAATPDGQLVPTPDDLDAARRQAEEARRLAEAEVERLRRELDLRDRQP